MSTSASTLSLPDFAGHSVTPDHPQYDRLRRVWNGSFDRYPALILQARTTDDVCAAIRLAATQGKPFAVRGGGHSIPGFSTCDGGIVLDLSLMNTVSVDPAARVVTVGGGALLGQIDAAGAPHGLVTPAGVISHTGVGGLTLGGGMGWLSRRFGMTIDSLLGARMVTASGDIVDCSADLEPELFWGLRGGGGNFGVVTEFRFRMHDLGPVRMGNWRYPLASAATALRAYSDLARAARREVSTSFTLSSTALSLTAFASGNTAGTQDAVLPFGQLGVPADGGLMPLSYCDFQSRNDTGAPWGRRYYSRGGFLHDLDDAAIEAMVTAAATAPTEDSEIYVLQLGGAVADMAEDATAYSGRSAGYYWVANPVWDAVKDDTACLDWGRGSARQLMALSMETNYVNEQGDSGSAVAEKAYGAAKYRRLAALKARFDGNNLFRLNQNILPARG
ncbi:FAD-binding oxidoreductase [Tabrizicola sp. BL-A-41-H6]|uniref:FAD-binding oxidoreductase n=1 Tax=Tabrizicola sp. BL-A-41-H6 TaxID=3421107 RepID=UPI003D67C151